MSASGMTPLRLHHVQITVLRGEDASARAFYCGVLGLCKIPKPATLEGRGGFWLGLAGQEIHVGTEDDVERRSTKAHLAYQVQDLAVWRVRLERAGACCSRVC